MKRTQNLMVLSAVLAATWLVVPAIAQNSARFLMVTTTRITNDPQSVANTGVISLGADTTNLGYLVVTNSGNICALFMLQGTNRNVAEINDAAGQFSVTAGTGSSTNVYWSSGNSRYELQNNTGGTLSYRLIRLGV